MRRNRRRWDRVPAAMGLGADATGAATHTRPSDFRPGGTRRRGGLRSAVCVTGLADERGQDAERLVLEQRRRLSRELAEPRRESPQSSGAVTGAHEPPPPD